MSKINCGYVHRIGKDADELRGLINLGTRLEGALTLRPHPRAGSSDEHPDYGAEYSPVGGRPRPMGAAWTKTNDRGAPFLSITLDDPDWTGPIYLIAFPFSNEPSSYTLVWTRPRPRTQDTEIKSEQDPPNTPSL